MSMAKGIRKIRIHFLRQLCVRLPPANADVVMLVGARLNWLLAHGKKDGRQMALLNKSDFG